MSLSSWVRTRTGWANLDRANAVRVSLAAPGEWRILIACQHGTEEIDERFPTQGEAEMRVDEMLRGTVSLIG